MADLATIGFRAETRDLRRAQKELDRLTDRGERTTRSVNLLRNAFVALGGALSVREIIAYSDSYKTVQNQLRLVTGSAEELLSVQAKLLSIANETASEFEGTTRLYTTLRRNTEDLNLSEERLLRVTELINKSFLVTGTSAQEASGAIRQLSQGLAAGALRGDEFNSVAEGAPEILRAVAKETGMAIGELREFAAQGGITAELLIRSLEGYGEELDKIAEKTDLAFGQKLTIARNNAVEFFGDMESGVGAIGAAGDAIVTLSENLDNLAEIAFAVGGLLAGRYVAGMVAATGATMAGVTAATALRRALMLLGGPGGIVGLLAAELYLYHKNMTDASEAAFKAANPHLELKVQLRDLEEQMQSTGEALQAYRDNLRNAKASGAGDATITVLENQIQKLENDLLNLAKTHERVRNQIANGGAVPEPGQDQQIAKLPKVNPDNVKESLPDREEMIATGSMWWDWFPDSAEQSMIDTQAIMDEWSPKLFEEFPEEARKTTKEIDSFTKRAAENMQDAMGDFFFDFMQGELGNLEDSFKRTIDRMVAEALAAQLGRKLFGGMVEGGSGEGLLGSLASAAFGFFGGGAAAGPVPPGIMDLSMSTLPSLDGGGYTGNGMRSGGMDGKGGFLAMMHPNETVIDHTKRSGQSGGINVTVQVSGVRDEGGLKRTSAQIAQAAGRASQRAIGRNS